MMEWILKIISFFRGKAAKQLPSSSTGEVLLDVDDSPMENHLHSLIRDAVIKVDQKRQEELRKLLDNSKLQSYFQSTIKAIAEKIAKDKGTSFLGPYTCGVPDGAWDSFMSIFTKTCHKMGMPVTSDGDHLRVEGAKVKVFFESISPSPVNVDERMRAMLSQGPYR